MFYNVSIGLAYMVAPGPCIGSGEDLKKTQLLIIIPGNLWKFESSIQ